MELRAASVRVLVAVILASFVLALRVEAHPGSGIVVDREGNVYFVVYGSSVIMKLSRDGKASTFVSTEQLRLPHHLVLGNDGTLYVASDFDGKVWRVGTDGTLREHFNSNRAPRPAPGSTEVFVGAFGDPFTVDSAGNILALASRGASSLIRITPDGKVTPVATTARFGALHFSSMAFGPDGALYVSDETRVWRVRGDSATAIVPRGAVLSQATGLSVDREGNVYVADYSARRIIRLAPDGSVNTPRALTRLTLQHPTGVWSTDEATYILDNPPRGVAVWRVVGDDIDRLYSRRDWQMYVQAAFMILFPLLLAIQTWVRKPSGRLDWFGWTVPIGAIIGLFYWMGQDAFVFSVARHAVLGVFLLGAVQSWRRRKGQTP